MQPSNKVEVLFEGRVPFILRKLRDEDQLVGPCYVHGRMNGDAIETRENSELVEETFKLH